MSLSAPPPPILILQRFVCFFTSSSISRAREAARYFPPTVVALARGALGGGGGELVSLLGEEIFGPVLPVLPFKDYDDACAIVRQIDSEPLALYVFARDRVAEK